MKLFLFYGRIVAVSLVLTVVVVAQNPIPPTKHPVEEVSPDKAEKSWRKKMAEEGRFKKSEPLLMAGDPRFQKMLLVALAPPNQIEQKLKLWPAWSEMSEERRERMTREIENFRNRINKVALKKADEAGIMLTEAQKPEFVRRYWEQRSKVELAVRQEVEGRLKTAMGQEMATLKQQFTKP